MKLIPFFSVCALFAAGAVFLAAYVFSLAAGRGSLLPKAEIGIVITDRQVRLDPETGQPVTEGICDVSAGLKTTLALRLAGTMDSVSSLGELRFLKLEEAETALADGSCDLVVYISSDTYDDINTGVNTPLAIRTSRAVSTQQRLFVSLITSAVRMLRTTEAAVYAPGLLTGRFKLADEAPAIGDRIFDACLSAILNREGLWNETSVSAYGDLSMTEFYSLTGLVFLLFLFGLGFTTSYTAEETAVIRLLARTGIGRVPLSLAVFFSDFCVYVLFGTGLTYISRIALLMLAGGFSAGSALTAFVSVLPSVLCVAFVLAAAVHLLGVAVPEEQRSLVWLLLTVTLFAAGGGLLPVVYLPKPLRLLTGFSPVILLQQLLSAGLFEETSSAAACSKNALKAVLMGLVLLLPALLLHARTGEVLQLRAQARKGRRCEKAWHSGPGFRSRLLWRGRIMALSQLRRPGFLALLILGILFRLLLTSVVLPHADNTAIGLFCEGTAGQSVQEKLLAQSTAYRYVVCGSKEELRQDVAAGRLDCGFVLDERLDEALTEGSLSSAGEAVLSSSTTKSFAAREEVFAVLLEVTMEQRLTDFAEEGLVFKEADEEETASLLEAYRSYMGSEALLTVELADPLTGEVRRIPEEAAGYTASGDAAETDSDAPEDGRAADPDASGTNTASEAPVTVILLFAASLFFAAGRFRSAGRSFREALRPGPRRLWLYADCLVPLLIVGAALLLMLLTDRPRGVSPAGLVLTLVIGLPLTALWTTVFSSCFKREPLFLFAAVIVLLLASALTLGGQSAVLHILTRQLAPLKWLFPTEWLMSFLSL